LPQKNAADFADGCTEAVGAGGHAKSAVRTRVSGVTLEVRKGASPQAVAHAAPPVRGLEDVSWEMGPMDVVLGTLKSIVGDRDVWALGIRIDVDEMVASDFLLPAILVAAAHDPCVPAGEGEWLMDLQADEEEAILGYRVLACALCVPSVLTLALIRCISQCAVGEKDSRRFVLDPVLALFGKWLDSVGHASDIVVNLDMRMALHAEPSDFVEKTDAASGRMPPGGDEVFDDARLSSSGREFPEAFRRGMRGRHAQHPSLQKDPAPKVAGPGTVVLGHVADKGTNAGIEVGKACEPVLGRRLPFAQLPQADAVIRAMDLVSPHAALLTRRLVGTLAGRSHAWVRPHLLVGPPGCGKSIFATAFMDAMGLHSEMFACGGVSDSSFAGCSRRWSTGGPSLPLSLVIRHRTASPGIVMDELDKVGTSRHNGSLADALCAMTDARTSRRWTDPYVQSEINISGVVWMATANTLADIPSVLRDRFVVVQFPKPGPEHLSVLMQGMLEEECRQRGLDAAWGYTPDGAELDALHQVWKGGSLRGLSRMAVAVLDARFSASAARSN
jgi:hypothetical protein